jgi:D-alanyl-lipoteichoic acid acyltransferase DltB (MBOAT superfamily)
MLFNSFEFLLIFLPLTLLVYLKISSARAALVWLSFASLVFYGYWNPIYLFLILGSILANFVLGKLIMRTAATSKYAITAFGVVFNASLLGYFKYANFFVVNVAAATGIDWSIDTIVLPLAISFFTFQQIAYLIDAYRGRVEEHGWIEYVAFVTFFPQLIAGPIVHHRDVLPQFRAIADLRKRTGNVGIGLTIFAIGLFKKVGIADALAVNANRVFDAALAGTPLSIAEAWGGTLAYSLQLYFDFSGYSDMAIGLGQMFGIALPVNFASPYKARNIIDFWRAWHITLSNFLRGYLYVPLGGSRYGSLMRYRNLLFTMLIGGMWHGAGWNFLIWGGLHGLFLVVNHLWRLAPLYGRLAGARLYGHGAWALTLFCVTVGWVFFRAETLAAAVTVLNGMFGLNGIDLPRALASALEPVLGSAATFGGPFPHIAAPWKSGLALILASGLLALLAPNVFDIFHDRFDVPMNSRVPYHPTRIRWKANWSWALLSGGMLAYCLLSLSEPSEFLYFQF